MCNDDDNKSVSLAFVPDPRSGLPKLVSEQTDIRERELAAWNEELRQSYELLSVPGGPKTFEFKTPLPGLPRHYQVTVQRSGINGMPKLLLTSLPDGQRRQTGLAAAQKASVVSSRDAWFAEQGETPSPSSPRRDWSAPHRESPAAVFGRDFVAALDNLLADIPKNAEQRTGVMQVLQDMRELAQQRSLDFMLVLVAGYLQIARRFGSDDQRDLAYLAASHLIDELCCIRLEDLQAAGVDQQEPLYARNSRRLWKTIFAD